MRLVLKRNTDLAIYAGQLAEDLYAALYNIDYVERGVTCDVSQDLASKLLGHVSEAISLLEQIHNNELDDPFEPKEIISRVRDFYTPKIKKILKKKRKAEKLGKRINGLTATCNIADTDKVISKQTNVVTTMNTIRTAMDSTVIQTKSEMSAVVSDD